MKSSRFIPIVFLILILPISVFADGGMIPHRPEIKVFEPGQTAIVAWNGYEEVMILSINVYASQGTKALQIVPLPAEPEISKGNISSFQNAEQLLPRPKVYQTYREEGTMKGDGVANKQQQSVEVLFYKEMDSHHITTVKVHVPEDFEKWFSDYIQKHNLSYSSVPQKALQLIMGYCQDGMRYFALDVVELEENQKTVSPVVYKFKSYSLYYPLRISSLNEGNTRILLYTITSPILYYSQEQLPARGFQYFGSRQLTGDEIRQISPEIEKVFKERIQKDQANILGGWMYQGSLQLSEDLLVKF
jgi:hypothetical protein